ncbi:PREDICTED: sphingolipid delta(4)-desaturase DES1-like [Priapulus caudatus]|uniref:sphingolipid 4-desaturase n=1 Tax=Priapulus caudatus TaxID=37621 RepID=A0ABM1EIV7_PRICU|nr:PREDICTED: sphingolipid delta(4)-desaturase DES1-like [Priapulus caudatus]XP_014672129.1 PREDICTED: sphingolipid delta(4)-desaturase DES1-like [Priapulus caudatus]
MGQKVSRTDFEWVGTDEPHATRRKEILKKYPQIKKLMGHDTNIKWIVLVAVIVQLVSCFFISSFSWPVVILAAYVFGGTINHSMMLAVHEISHNLAFGHAYPLRNRALGMLANSVIGVPMSVTFKGYHLEHHRYQGDEVMDGDLPSALEARLFQHTFTKFIWVLLQPLFYGLRPVLMRPKPMTPLELVNLVTQVAFNVAIWYCFGTKAIVYLLSGSLLAMGLHPVAGHFISEHYMFKKGFETYSYYGVLNAITFNVGYHNEHHDFPSVPGSRLPEVRRIAPEFYDNLPCHDSWTKVLYDFIFDPEIGPYARVKRHHLVTKKENLDGLDIQLINTQRGSTDFDGIKAD